LAADKSACRATSDVAALNQAEDIMASAASVNAIQKLEKFFAGLSSDEQEVISEMVRASLLQAAEHFAGASVAAVPGAAEAFDIPKFVSGLTGANAPALVKALRLPGSLAAHSIPGCNASALVALKAQFG
jgi:hypothetical protein